MKLLLLAVSLSLAMAIGAALVEKTSAPPAPVVSGMTFEGDEVVLTVRIPPGFSHAKLQTKTDLAGEWKNGMDIATSTNGETAKFHFPRREDMLFMRVVASAANANSESGGISFLPVSHAPATNAAKHAKGKKGAVDPHLIGTLHFKAIVDGLETIQIGPEGIIWNHLRYEAVDVVSLNGRTWKPSEVNLVDLRSDFNGKQISWQDTEIERISGRDIVALEKLNGSAAIHVYDTPWGAAEYEFVVRLFGSKRARPSKAPATRLTISAFIDGTDELTISATGAHWVHKQWGEPSNVRIAGERWDTVTVSNWEKALVPAGIDFSRARLISKSGRGFINLEARGNDLVVSFADDGDGGADYEVEIGFDN